MPDIVFVSIDFPTRGARRGLEYYQRAGNTRFDGFRRKFTPLLRANKSSKSTTRRNNYSTIFNCFPISFNCAR